MRKSEEVHRILVVRFSAMGDVLLTTPLVRMLRKRFPDAPIDFLVKAPYEPLLRTNVHLNHILTFSAEKGFPEWIRILRRIRATTYDTIIDLQANFRSRLLRLFAKGRITIPYRPPRWRRFLLVHFRINTYKETKSVALRFLDLVSVLGVEDDGKGLELWVEEKAKHSVASHLKKRGYQEGEKIIALAPGAGRKTKRWPTEKYADTGNHFSRIGYRVVLLGGRGDGDVCEEVAQKMDSRAWNFAGQFSLQETAALLLQSKLLVSNDTGAMHMAAAVGKPVVAIFGPTTRHLGFMPFRASCTVIEKSLPCRPCSYHGTDACPKGHFRCMREIESSDVIRAAEGLVKKEYR